MGILTCPGGARGVTEFSEPFFRVSVVSKSVNAQALLYFEKALHGNKTTIFI
jgi:hypothetical protein